MIQRKMTLIGAALAAALLAASAGAVAQTRSGTGDPAATMPRGGPMSPSESDSRAVREYQGPIAPRGDNPRLPNPVTPSAANESAPAPHGVLYDQTNQSGMPTEKPVGATR